MKLKTLLTSLFCANVLMFAFADKVVVNDWESPEYDGTTEVGDDLVYSGPFAEWLEKTGSATWTLPLDKVATHNPLKVAVYSGKIKLTDNDTRPAVSAPPAILNQALFWVDANKNVVVDENSAVSAWYDCRESITDGVYGNIYPAAIAVKPAWAENIVYPQLKTEDNTTGVWFGGKSDSGATMRFYAAADRSQAQALEKLIEVFLVIKVKNGLGNTLGAKNGGTQYFHSGSIDTLKGNYLARTASLILASGVNQLNGKVFDPFTTVVQSGTQLWSFHHPVRNVVSADYFFNDRELDKRAGGDYLLEAVFFNKCLSLEERTDIENYLMNKWQIASAPVDTHVKIATGAEVEISKVPNGFTADGNGTIAVSNPPEGSRLNVYGYGNTFRGNVNVVSGSITIGAAALEAQAASAVAMDAVKTLNGGDYIVSAGKGKDKEVIINVVETVDPSRLEGQVRFNNIPASVTNLVVNAQTVSLSAPRELADGTSFKNVSTPRNADFIDAGFEGHQGNATFKTTTTIDGWTYSDLVNTEIYYNLNQGWWSDYIVPPQGKRAMGIKGNGSVSPWTARASTPVTIHTEGVYELSFSTYGRITTSMVQAKISVKGSDGTEHVLGAVTSYPLLGYSKRKYRTPSLKPGVYELILDAYSLGDSLSNYDDFKLSLVPDQERSEIFPVPYGTFGNVSYISEYKRMHQPHSYIKVKEWELTLGGRGALNSGCPSVAVGSIGMEPKNFYNMASSRYGDTQLTFWDGDGKITSSVFKLPSTGKWKLKCRASRWGVSDWWPGINSLLTAAYSPTFSASLLINGSECSLGSITANSYIFSDFTFPDAIKINAEDSVSVIVKQTITDAAGQLDDLVLVKVDDEIILKDDFESMTGWTLKANDTAQTVGAAKQQNHYVASFGNTHSSGYYALMLVDLGSAEKELVFNEGGVYRLSFWARPRFYENSVYPNRYRHGGNRIRASISDDVTGIETEILTTHSLYETNFVEFTALFKIPSTNLPVRRTLKLAGMNDAVNVKTGKLGWNNDLDVFIDDLTVSKCPAAEIEINPELTISLAKGAILNLDFGGVKAVKEVRIGGRRLSGTINAATYPTLVSGIGSLYAEPPGFFLIVK